jgi:hypothetical protein
MKQSLKYSINKLISDDVWGGCRRPVWDISAEFVDKTTWEDICNQIWTTIAESQVRTIRGPVSDTIDNFVK